MIQLANDPNAGRTFGAAANEEKAGSILDAVRPGRNPVDPYNERRSDVSEPRRVAGLDGKRRPDQDFVRSNRWRASSVRV